MNKKCCVLVYNSFGDPLFQNIMLPYMRTLVSESGWRFHLITFEQPEYLIDPTERERINKQLNDEGIMWYPRRHRTGKFLVAKKVLDFSSVGFLLLRLRAKGVCVLWSFANVAASIAWVYSRLLAYRTIIYSYEPHSEFMRELGLWNKNSLNYRLLSALERRAGRDADYVLTGTQYMVDSLHARGVKGKVYRAPTSADHTRFYPDPDARKTLEAQYKINSADKLILYMGKFGGLYYTYEIFQLFRILTDHIPNCRCAVITPNSDDEITELCKQADFDRSRLIYITHPSLDEIRTWLSAADLGVSAIPPTPSQKYRSPTKVAEYLMCGLPYITVAGVSEDDLIAREHDVGIVVNVFSEESILAMVPTIANFMRRDRREMRSRCREVGLAYRGKANVDRVLSQVFGELEGVC